MKLTLAKKPIQELLEQLFVFLAVSFILDTPQHIRSALLRTFGTGEFIRPLLLYCLVIPALYIAFQKIRRREPPVFPHFLSFSLLVLTILATESFAEIQRGETNFVFLFRECTLFTWFLLLANYKPPAQRIVAYGFACSLINVGVSFLELSGVLNISSQWGQILEARPDLSVHPNMLAYRIMLLNVFSILRVHFRPPKNAGGAVGYLGLSCLTIVLIAAMATRGATVLNILVSLWLLRTILQQRASRQMTTRITYAAIVIGTLLMSSFFSDWQTTVLDLHVTERFEKLDTRSGRFEEVQNNLENFLSSPLVGVGEAFGAATFTNYMGRGNNQYTQVLAAGGLLLFGVWAWHYSRLYWWVLLRKELRWLSVLALVVIFVSGVTRPQSWYSIIAYLLHCYRPPKKKAPQLARYRLAA
jgi:hypothetical protein